MEKQLILTFNGDGTYSLDAVGFTGKACRDASAAYETALGPTVDRKPKPEATQGEGTRVGAR